MSKIMDDRLKKEAAIIRKLDSYQFALKLFGNEKLTLDEIAYVCDLTIDEVKELAEENNIVIA